jgi:glycosyltransferase involved in cell wall biosynthesis
MAAADLFVLSSHYEGLPNVLIEALTVGTPVVTTDCPSGPREILVDGEGGKLVPVGDPSAMAEAIETAIDSTTQTQRELERARESLDRFTLDAAVEQYLGLLPDRCGE